MPPKVEAMTMPRITQQIMIMIFFCSGIPAAVGREGRGDGECWGRMDPGVQNGSLSCSPLPVVGSEQHPGSLKGLAVLGREGHSCSCPGLAELSWWPSGSRTDSWHCAQSLS